MGWLESVVSASAIFALAFEGERSIGEEGNCPAGHRQ